MNYPCPCCGYLVLEEKLGGYDTCPICYWEDDPVQLNEPTYDDGCNRVSLIEAQRNFANCGASDPRWLPYVRKATSRDKRDPEWFPISDDMIDDLRECVNELRRSGNTVQYCYWRKDYNYKNKG